VPGLAVVDRYERKELDGVALPGPVAALRLDPLGRWLLARPAVGDSAWIVDLPIKASHRHRPHCLEVGSASNLAGRVLIYRRGNDVVSARPDSLSDVGKVPNAAADMWVLTTWLPRGVPSSTVSSTTSDSSGTGAEGPLYVQVSTSQNPEWSGQSRGRSHARGIGSARPAATAPRTMAIASCWAPTRPARRPKPRDDAWAAPSGSTSPGQ